MVAITFSVILAAVIASVGYGFSGWWKSQQTDNPAMPENIDWLKFFSTFVISVILGVILVYSGQSVTIDTFQGGLGMLTTIGGTVIVENILKGIKRRLSR